jgi:hypothetical protein
MMIDETIFPGIVSARRWSRALGCTVFACALNATSVSASELRHRFSTYGLLEAWDDQTAPFHGAGLLRWDVEKLPANAKLGIEFNTDTLRIEYDGVRLSEVLEFGAQLTGEIYGANVLFDYFQQGENKPQRTFRASFVMLKSWLRLRLFEHLFVQPELGARRWFFSSIANSTSPTFILPTERFAAEPRLRLLWWSLKHDVVWSERQRLYPRLRGWALGTTLGLNWRNESAPWGAITPDDSLPVDPRNSPSLLQYNFVQWLWAGWQVVPGFRMQWMEELAWTEGEDDLTRRQIGGMTPFTVNIPGAPWAYFHAGDYAGLQWTTHFALPLDGLEIGTVSSLVFIKDIDRIGSQKMVGIWGAGALLDWRMEQWQFDLRAGYSPALRAQHPRQDAWSLLFSLGWGNTW